MSENARDDALVEQRSLGIFGELVPADSNRTRRRREGIADDRAGGDEDTDRWLVLVTDPKAIVHDRDNNVEVRLPADECERWAETAVRRPDHRWAHALPSRVLC
ncbi:hypothetical protein [Plantibacter sp. YIM 135347]|uniref:hypothetical protein n=1 Tax=Plantibacter sp. YIM 135347 TaxID=3423919 RepID=UPI003D353EF6